MKKNLAKAMAVATAFGAVVPAVQPVFANEVSTLAFPSKDQENKITLNVREANGYTTKATVASRTTLYNTNNTQSRNDDTLKNAYKDIKILAEKQDKDNSYNDKIAYVTKITDVAVINTAAANLKTAETLIKEAQADKDATVTKKEYAASFNGTDYTEARIEVTVTKGSDTTIYVFEGVEGIKEDTTETVADLKEIFTDLNEKLTTDVTINGDDEALTLEIDLAQETSYNDLNRIKYAIEKNVAKFDIVKEESGIDNADLDVVLYKKGSEQVAKNAVLKLTLKNVAKVDKTLVKNIPAKGDFTGHWAEAEIVEAMLLGQVDTSATFRPKDSVTRAEFAKIVCTVFEIGIEDTDVANIDEPFTDVKKGDWFYNVVTALYNYNGKKGAVVGGYEDETFRPNAKITREEAAKMMAAAYEIKNASEKLHVAYDKDIEVNKFTEAQVGTGTAGDGIVDVVVTFAGQEVHRDIKTKFTDDATIAAWADEAVQALNDKKIILGNPDGTFKAKSQINRAEALLMITRAGNTK